ncbi:MAG: multidrug efflux pump subunit AcrA (membrane-fusion protein) [bacterium]|jgi:multidrug efflux pump subunit AcrA (membrane-fusion protein)
MSLKKGILLLTLFSFFFVGCGERRKKKKVVEVIRPVKVKKIENSLGSDNSNSFNGNARGIREAILSFRVPGVITKLRYKVGGSVKKNAVAAVLDNRDYRIQVRSLNSKLRSAQAQLDQLKKGARKEDLRILQSRLNSSISAEKSAKTTYNNTRSEYQRVLQLYSKQIASKSRLDQVKNQLDLSKTQWEQSKQSVNASRNELNKGKAGGRDEELRAKRANIRSIAENLNQAKANLADTQLKIPFNGTISSKHLSAHEQVAAGKPIYTIVNTDQIEIQISVPESMITQISRKQSVSVNFLNFPKRKFSGKITKIGISADRTTLTYPVFVEINNRQKIIRPGMTANVTIKSSQITTSYPTIPIHSILQDKVSKAKFVWIFDRITSTVKKRFIVLGSIQNEEIEVLDGIRNGDYIITAGVHSVKENLKVRILK